jgi:hypothetical protein
MELKLPLRIAAFVSAVSLLAYACGESTRPVGGQPASLTLVPSRVQLDAVGATEDLTATVYDAEGNVIDTTVQFEPSDPSVIAVSAGGTVTATGTGVASVTASLGSLSKTSEINVFPVGSDVEKLSGDLQSAVVANMLPEPLVVRVSDPGGGAVPGIEIFFTVVSGGGSVSVDSATTDANGQASTEFTLGTTAGAVHQVAASAGGVGRTEFLATGLADAAQSAQAIAGDGQIQPVGTVLPVGLAVLVSDQHGNGVPGQDVTYEVLTGGGSITPASLQTDATGVAQGQWTIGGALGAQTAQANVPGVSTTLPFSAEGTDLTVTGFSVDTLVEGQPATITGTGFGTVTRNITVTVDGSVAQVNAATTTTIDIDVPKTQCFPARDVDVVVTTTTGGTAPAQTKPVKAGDFMNMAVGEMMLLQDPTEYCFHFGEEPTSRSYLLGVQSTVTAGASLTGVSVAGQVQTPGPAFASAIPAADMTRSAPRFAPVQLDERAERWRRHREAEAEWLEAEWQYGQALLEAGADIASAPSQQLIDSTVSVGTSVSFKVPMLSSTCTDFTTVTATVEAVGTRGIWLSDDNNPAPGYTGADFQSLSDALDNFIFDEDTSYFGAPTDLDRNGRIVVLITQQLNQDAPNVLGFVTSRDLFSEAQCGASNNAEVFYGRAPDTGYPRAQALADGPPLIAHEFTHIIQFGRRLIVNGSPSLGVVMSEGQATMAEEVVGHAALGNSPGRNYGAGIAGDVGGTDPNNWYEFPFTDISFYYGRGLSGSTLADAPHSCSWLTVNPAPCQGRPLWYGVTWSLLRWVNDHFGPTFSGGERGIQQAIVNNDATGLQNIEDVIGTPTETFLAEWAASLYLDDRGVIGLPSRIDFPSWNLLDIYESGTIPGFRRLDPARFVFADFARDVDVRAASTAYFVLSGAVVAPAAVRVRDQTDQFVSPRIQIFLVRMN